MTRPWDNYIKAVKSGKITACREVKQSVTRFEKLMANDDYYFDDKAVMRVIDFTHMLHHFTGKFSGKPFELQPWQTFIVAAIYGPHYKATGLRVVRSVYLEMARKQGKSALAAALCLYHEIADDEPGAEVYLAANSKDQAKISFRMCRNFARTLDPREEILKPFRDAISFDARDSFLRVLAADDSKLDGFNAHAYLLDEYQAAKNNRLRDVLQSSQGMRRQPMRIIITTAGFDKLGVCYQYRTVCEEILSGIKQDDTLFVAIYTLDEGDDWRNPKVWIKSNPNLGVTVDPQYIAEQVNVAKNSSADEVGVKTKNLNLWCDASEVWIPDSYLLSASRKITDEELAECEQIYGGVDLSSTSDLTAMAVMGVRKDGVFLLKLYYYLPEASLITKRFKIRYGEWRRQGFMTITDGNVTDYDYILNDLTKIDEKSPFYAIGYDPYNATQFVINCTTAGLPMCPYSQTIGNFNKPTKELERAILCGKVIIDANDITLHCFRNVQMALDRNGNTKPTKQFAEKKIDGVIAAIEAMGVYLDNPLSGSTEI